MPSSANPPPFETWFYLRAYTASFFNVSPETVGGVEGRGGVRYASKVTYTRIVCEFYHPNCTGTKQTSAATVPGSGSTIDAVHPVAAVCRVMK